MPREKSTGGDHVFNFPEESAWKYICSWQVTFPAAAVIPLSIWVFRDTGTLASTIKSVASSYWGGAFWISSTACLFVSIIILRDRYKAIIREKEKHINERDAKISELTKEVESLKGGKSNG